MGCDIHVAIFATKFIIYINLELVFSLSLFSRDDLKTDLNCGCAA